MQPFFQKSILAAMKNLFYRSFRRKPARPILSLFFIIRGTIICLQYAVVQISITQHHWRWFHSSLKRENRIVKCRNAASVSALFSCLATLKNPLPKSDFEEVGRMQGLLVTHDISFHPASGLCLGVALRFLSEYAAAVGSERSRIIQAARSIQGGADRVSVCLQSLYDALLGMKGKSDRQELALFRQLLRGEALSGNSHHSELWDSVVRFLAENPNRALRQFILEDLEGRDIDISPNLYSLILEIDAQWQAQNHAGQGAFHYYDPVHNSVRQAVGEYAGLTLVNSVRFTGELSIVLNQLCALERGLYLIEFPSHILPMVKTDAVAAIGDAGEGVSLFPLEEQEENISHLLAFYSRSDLISVNVQLFTPAAV